MSVRHTTFLYLLTSNICSQELVQKEIEVLKEKFPGESSSFDVIDSTGSFSEIACCSYEARACGVRNGMLLGAAAKLCPDLRTIPYDFEVNFLPLKQTGLSRPEEL